MFTNASRRTQPPIRSGKGMRCYTSEWADVCECRQWAMDAPRYPQHACHLAATIKSLLIVL